MSNKLDPRPDSDHLVVYQIRVVGHLGDHWAEWFECLTLTLEENGETLLTCAVIDQSALYGVLRKVRDSGMPLISVMRIEPEQEGDSS